MTPFFNMPKFVLLPLDVAVAPILVLGIGTLLLIAAGIAGVVVAVVLIIKNMRKKK